MTADGKDPVHASVDAFRRIVRALRRAAQRTQQRAGMSAAQLFVLRQLAEGDGLSLTELAGRTLTDRTSVRGVVERLQEQGLVSVARSEQDRRRTEVRLTPPGRARLAAAPPPPTELLVRGLARLPAAELERLAGGLGQLTAAMGLDAEPADFLFEDGRREADREG